VKRLSVNLELIEIGYHQDQITENQKRIIAKLVNQTVEQENLINELMSDVED